MSIKCYYANVQSIANKWTDIKHEIDRNNFKILGFTESWCRDETNEELNITNFQMFRKDRIMQRGGGTLLYIHESIGTAIELLPQDGATDDSIWIKLNKPKGDKWIIALVYRSPSSPMENNLKLLENIKYILREHKPTHFMLFGDFNLPSINWETGTCPEGEDSMSSRFLEATKDSFLFQHVTGSTRFRGTQQSRLDLIFTNEEEMIDSIEKESPPGKSDHVALKWNFIVKGKVKSEPKTHERFHFTKGNYEAIRQELDGTDWESILRNETVENQWTIFKKKINQLSELHIPKKKNNRKNSTPWCNKELKRELKRKNTEFHKFRRSGSQVDYSAYVRQRNATCNLNQSLRKKYERKLMDEYKTNPKQFYAYARRNQKVKVGIAKLKKENGTETSDDKETVEELNSYFTKVFTREGNEEIPPFNRQTRTQQHDLNIEKEEIVKILSSLNAWKAMGPDEIHPAVLKNCSNEIAEPLRIIFRSTLDQGKIPNDWKKANVTPIFKKGLRSEASNYRPVSLTSQVCKVMEKIINSRIQEHIVENEILRQNQHGFTSGRSCLTNLLTALDNWTKEMDQGNSVDVIYLDFAKAFDSVPHKRLLKKLEGYGIRGKLLAWIKDFLQHRQQRVIYNDEVSEWTQVLSGVPQGSVLGPTLFILYVMDIPEVINSSVDMFADDTKLYRAIQKDEDIEILQRDINNLMEWSRIWMMKFNVKKCKHMRISRNSVAPEYYMYDGTEHQRLELIEKEKDLGIYITNNMKVEDQCIDAANKANRALGLINRSFKYHNPRSFTNLYKSYVRPHLEFAVQAWSPHLKKDIQTLEKVQRRATRLIHGMENLTYQDRLIKSGLYSLECRRQRGDLIETFKILKGLEDVQADKFFTLSHNTSTRGGTHKVFKPRFNTNVRGKFFSQRSIDLWNSLPDSIKNMKTVISFKGSLDRYWKSIKFGHQIDL